MSCRVLSVPEKSRIDFFDENGKLTPESLFIRDYGLNLYEKCKGFDFDLFFNHWKKSLYDFSQDFPRFGIAEMNEIVRNLRTVPLPVSKQLASAEDAKREAEMEEIRENTRQTVNEFINGSDEFRLKHLEEIIAKMNFGFLYIEDEILKNVIERIEFAGIDFQKLLINEYRGSVMVLFGHNEKQWKHFIRNCKTWNEVFKKVEKSANRRNVIAPSINRLKKKLAVNKLIEILSNKK